jgi:hypothetical protein
MLTKGPFLDRFERALADRLGVRHAVAVSSCTVGLMLAYKALDIAAGRCDACAGDRPACPLVSAEPLGRFGMARAGGRSEPVGEVIMPSFTFLAAPAAVVWNNLRPVFVDVDPDSTNVTPQAVAAAITPPRTDAITRRFGISERRTSTNVIGRALSKISTKTQTPRSTTRGSPGHLFGSATHAMGRESHTRSNDLQHSGSWRRGNGSLRIRRRYLSQCEPNGNSASTSTASTSSLYTNRMAPVARRRGRDRSSPLYLYEEREKKQARQEEREKAEGKDCRRKA